MDFHGLKVADFDHFYALTMSMKKLVTNVMCDVKPGSRSEQ
jgi:hypothetical protein